MNDIECAVVKSDSTCYWKDMWRKLDRMRQVWQLTDVSLVTKDKIVFMAHSPVLAASSNFFHDLLIRQTTDSCEQSTRSLFLDEINSDVLKVTLDFIYGITPLTGLSFERLQIGAKELGIIGAYEYCSKHLKKINTTMSGYQTEDFVFVNNSNSGILGENLTSSTCPIELSCILKSSRISESITPISTELVSNLWNGKEKLAVDGIESPVSVADWSVKMSDSMSDSQRTKGHAENVNSYDSIYSSNVKLQNNELDVRDEIPSDDVHTTIFTQMSLGDLTAELRCPHMKGIIGENNPMERFFSEEELDDNMIKEPRSPQDAESDFGDPPSALEAQTVGVVAQMPLKKRRRLSPDIGEQAVSTSPKDNYISDRNTKESTLISLEVNDSLHKTNNQKLGMQICGSAPSRCSSSCTSGKSLSLAIIIDEKKPLNESVELTTLTENRNPIEVICKELETVNQSFVKDLLPNHDGPFSYPCISAAVQQYQLLNKCTDSDDGITKPSIAHKKHSLDFINGGFSDGLMNSETFFSCVSTTAFTLEVLGDRRNSVNDSIFTVPSDTSTVASYSGSFCHLVTPQIPETSCKKSNAWNVSVSRPDLDAAVDYLNLSKQEPWKLVSNTGSSSNFSQGQEMVLDPTDISSCFETDVACKSKNYSTHENASNQFSNEITSNILSTANTGSEVSFDNGEIFNFPVSGSLPGTVPISAVRNPPNSGDTSIYLSAETGIALHKSRHPTGTVVIEQIGYGSLSSDSNEVLSQSAVGKWCCSICAKVFKSASQLNIHHKRIHLPSASTSCPTSNRCGGLHQCQYCQELFKSSYKLQTHQLKVHSKGKLFSCKDCNFRSPRKKDVQAHMLSQHGFAPSGVKVYSCSTCNYKCIDRNRFEEHEAKHTGITSHCCPLCSRAYTTKRGMRTHLKYHSEERPYKCSICGAAFKVTSKLSDHMKLIHLQKGVKPYKCGYCDHATALRGNCNQHIRKNHPGQPLLVIDKFASRRKCVKDYDYAGMAGDGIVEHQDLEAARVSIHIDKKSF